ncbi:Alpha/Beta hydrolase protein [Gamsiella multidivaricata]|uniref:Alpha/Beta hydrolase protein n=1 Tax=Gamsiella multidivaricata TaxID=101098 RepID=UPI00221F6E07|nr:Alpha/Beta hydrolase protein [Gamsiella multidivaricata]KAI7827662.1 Alpha/Beta hydrolase protein [Gamsiella multidivaricata]
MALAAGVSVAAAASAALAVLGARKVYKSLTAERGCTLPSLRAVTSHSAIAYPEDYYPGGSYADLSFGETHYFLFGPEDGKKVVFVHGLSTPASVYDKVARHMANNGCRVLLYDLYSRGYTVGPAVAHDPLLYVTQLHDLLKHVGWKRCNFVGLSLGGGIVACYAHRFPEAVESLTFIAPGGLLSPSDIPWVGKIFLLPYSEEIFSHKSIKGYFSTKNIESMRNEFKSEPKVPECIDEACKILALQFQHHAGYARGLMSTLRRFPLTELRPEYAASQQQAYPVQVIWGTKDAVVPGTTIDTLQQLVPRVKVTRVEGATHSIVMTHPNAIIEQLEPIVR